MKLSIASNIPPRRRKIALRAASFNSNICLKYTKFVVAIFLSRHENEINYFAKNVSPLISQVVKLSISSNSSQTVGTSLLTFSINDFRPIVNSQSKSRTWLSPNHHYHSSTTLFIARHQIVIKSSLILLCISIKFYKYIFQSWMNFVLKQVFVNQRCALSTPKYTLELQTMHLIT